MTIIGEGCDAAITPADRNAVILPSEFGDGNVIHHPKFPAFSTGACGVNTDILLVDPIVTAAAPCHRENGDFRAFILAVWRAIDVLSVRVEVSVTGVNLHAEEAARRTLSFTGRICTCGEISCRTGEVHTTGHTDIILHSLIHATDDDLTDCVRSIRWVASIVFGARRTGDTGVCTDRFVCLAEGRLTGGIGPRGIIARIILGTRWAGDAGVSADRFVRRAGVASQVVSAADASSPAALVVPAGQATQVFPLTASFAAQRVASQVVSAADASSPAALVVPAGQATQAFALTASLAAQRGGITGGIGR